MRKRTVIIIACIPENSYEDDLLKNIEGLSGDYFSDDFVSIRIVTYKDDYCSSCMESVNNGNGIPDDAFQNELLSNTIYLYN